MANHQFACLASQTANEGDLIAVYQLKTKHFGLLRQKSAVFPVARGSRPA
jgi:hypothetical protein